MSEKIATLKSLERISGQSLSLGLFLESIRLGEEMSQVEFAKKIKNSRSHLYDIKKGRKLVRSSRVVEIANTLGYSPIQFVRLSLQDELSKSGLKFKVQVYVA